MLRERLLKERKEGVLPPPPNNKNELTQNQNLLDQLKELLRRKRSEQWYADKLGITVDEVKELKKELKGKKYDEGEKFLSTATNSKQFEDAVRKPSDSTPPETTPIDPGQTPLPFHPHPDFVY